MSLALEASQRRRRRFHWVSAVAPNSAVEGPTTAPPLAEALELLRTRIRLHASTFELPALLSALKLLGYPMDRVRLVSQRSHLSASGLVHSVHFPEQPQLPVEIHLNFGLLSADGPLPSYFSRLFESPELDGELLLNFLHTFDHELLFRHVQGLAPTHAPELMPLHDALTKQVLPMLRPSSPATLEWIVRKVFPELVVQLRRRQGTRMVQGEALTLGQSALSQGDTLGGRWLGHVSCLSIRLTALEVIRLDGRLWQEVVHERLQRWILPLLSQTETLLELVLALPGEPSAIRLEPLGRKSAQRADASTDGSEETRLGYQALKTPPAEEVELLIYRGCPRDLQL